jgi:hypothetical protein
MAEQTYQQLNGDKNRIERSISYVKRGINTNKKFAQGIEYSKELRAKSLAELKKNEAELKRLEADLKETNTALDKIAAEERAAKGKKEVSAIEKKYSTLEESLALQLDPNSESAGKIKDKMASLVNDYKSALTDVSGRAISEVEARSKLTGKEAPSFGTSSTGLTPVQSGEAALAKSSTSNLPKNPLPSTGGPTKSTTVKPATNVDIGTPEERIKESTGNAGGGKDTGAADAEAKAAGLNEAAALNLAGTLFEHVDSLKELLRLYVKEGWTNTRFLQELRNDAWYKKNSAEIKARYTQLYNYQDLVASGQADGSTDYEKQIRTLKDQVTKKAREMGSGLASDPAAIQRAAENMYITNTGIDDALTNNLIAAAIRPIGSTIGGKPTEGYSGTALANYQLIQDAARKNGFTVADIIPGGSNEQQVLQGIATGAIDVNRIAQDARRLAAQGQPQYVRDLLGQGYNLEQIYSPYRQTMANILEIGDPAQISLNDPTLRMAITDKGDMNLYDFKKALRQDNRWQYTDTAKQEVSTAALSVLRDFGFQG